MGRPIVEVEIGDEKLNAVLDTGAWNSYIRKDIATNLPKVSVEPFHSRLGGKSYNITEGRVIEGYLKDSENRKYKLGVILYPVDDLGKEDEKRIDILFGAVLLEAWGTVIDESTIPPKVDFKRLREGELVELIEDIVK